jgi:hypothetical protein
VEGLFVDNHQYLNVNGPISAHNRGVATQYFVDGWEVWVDEELEEELLRLMPSLIAITFYSSEGH